MNEILQMFAIPTFPIRVGGRVKVKVSGGWKSGWLEGTVEKISGEYHEIRLDCDDYIVKGHGTEFIIGIA